jgi:hypothetical protein
MYLEGGARVWHIVIGEISEILAMILGIRKCGKEAIFIKYCGLITCQVAGF